MASSSYARTHLRLAQILGLGVGPLILGPLSSSIGRRSTLLLAWTLFIPCGFWMAFSKSYSAFAAGRFFAGFFSSVAQTVPAAQIADIFSPRVRGTAVAVWSLAIVGKSVYRRWRGPSQFGSSIECQHVSHLRAITSWTCLRTVGRCSARHRRRPQVAMDLLSCHHDVRRRLGHDHRLRPRDALHPTSRRHRFHRHLRSRYLCWFRLRQRLKRRKGCRFRSHVYPFSKCCARNGHHRRSPRRCMDALAQPWLVP